MTVAVDASPFDIVLEFIPELWDLLADTSVTEIMVNRGGLEVFIERHGQLVRVDLPMDTENFITALENMAKRAGVVLNSSHPLLETMLNDGSRVTAAIPPNSVDGATLNIRKFNRHYTIDELVEAGSAPRAVADLLLVAVHLQQNILISGRTSSGKTSWLNALANTIPLTDRIVLIEDTSEVVIHQPRHVVRFISSDEQPAVHKEPAIPAVTLDHLLRHTMRCRPDRIILGEVRGGAAWQLMSLLNTGHAGSLCTIHANSAELALTRLMMSVSESGIKLPLAVVRQAVADAIHLVVHLDKSRDPADMGARKVMEVRRVEGVAHRKIQTTLLFPNTLKGHR